MMGSMVKVRFITAFPPYHVNAGDTREVSENVAKKLLTEYHVIEDYAREKDRVIVVRVVDIEIMKELGKEWYPYSTHIMMASAAKPYLEAGRLVLGDEHVPQFHDGGSPGTEDDGHGKEVEHTGTPASMPVDDYGIEYFADGHPSMCYVVLEDFVADGLVYRKGLRFCNSIVDFSRMVASGKLGREGVLNGN